MIGVYCVVKIRINHLNHLGPASGKLWNFEGNNRCNLATWLFFRISPGRFWQRLNPKIGKDYWNILKSIFLGGLFHHWNVPCPRTGQTKTCARPLYFFSSRTGQHATPAQLQQYYLRCPATSKPLAVLHLLDWCSGVNWSQSLETRGSERSLFFSHHQIRRTTLTSRNTYSKVLAKIVNMWRLQRGSGKLKGTW